MELSVEEQNPIVELEKEKIPMVELEVEEVFEGGGGGTPAQTTDYEKLKNKPSINEVELSGNKSFEELGISSLSNLEIMQIINKAMGKGV